MAQNRQKNALKAGQKQSENLRFVFPQPLSLHVVVVGIQLEHMQMVNVRLKERRDAENHRQKSKKQSHVLSPYSFKNDAITRRKTSGLSKKE